MTHISRRSFLAVSTLGVALSYRQARAGNPTFFRNAGCGCCHKWSQALAASGLPVTLLDVDDLDAEHTRLGVPAPLRGCHVGQIGPYVISGHVPPADILRLLTDLPPGLGLAVPGMPVGSPGMEYQNEIEPYSVLLFQPDGSTVEFARYG